MKLESDATRRDLIQILQDVRVRFAFLRLSNAWNCRGSCSLPLGVLREFGSRVIGSHECRLATARPKERRTRQWR